MNEEKSLSELLEDRISYWIDSQAEHPLLQASAYSVSGGAKRLRPLILLDLLDSLGIDPVLGLDPACSLEFLHTYSLIHDDLPSIDNDELRRGKPTTHKVFGEAIALLSGDFLLTYSFEILSQAKDLPSEVKIGLIELLAKKGGLTGMIGGQVLDLFLDKTEISFTDLEEVYIKKTGSLFQCAFEFASIIANLSTDKRKSFEDIGKKFGLAYQILDDIEDYDINKNDLNICRILGKEEAIKICLSLIFSCNEMLLSYKVPIIKRFISNFNHRLSVYATIS